MRKIFEPAVLLMNRLRYPRKFALMALLFSLPVVLFLYLLISEINKDVSFARKERLGLEFEHAVMKFFQDVQLHRGLASAVIEGGVSFQENLREMQTRIESDIKAVDALDNKHGRIIAITTEWDPIKEKWGAISTGVSGRRDAKTSFEMHTTLINDTLSLIGSIADVSNLARDREIGGFYLADTVINKLPMAAEYTGLIRGLGISAIMLPGEITTGERSHLIVLAGLAESAVNKTNSNLAKAFKTDPDLEPKILAHLRNNNAAIASALQVLEERVINPAEVGIRPEEFIDTFTRAGTSINALHTAVIAALEEVLQNRMESLSGKMTFIGWFAALMLLITAYLFAGNYWSVMASLASLMGAAKRVGSGDLQARVVLEAKDEMSMLAGGFNEMASRLAAAMEELRRSNEELERFAYLASHDLKSPLLVVVGNLKAYERRYKGKFEVEADRFIAEAIRSAIRMEKLISDILAYARAGTHGKPFEAVDSSEALRAALENLKVNIEESGVAITHDHLPTVTADLVQLIQLFQNLIGNAIKFRGEENPRIHVSAVKQGKDWIFAIRDNGIGIPAEQIEQVFEIFHRYHSEKYPGTGIGLATCKKIVERHHGRIWVESEPGKGSVFYFSIPVATSLPLDRRPDLN